MITTRRDIVLSILGCAIVVATITAARWFGPGDLYEKDQPKTIAYTADVVLHHRFALPRDVIYQPATKPPMYNWIGAAAIWVSGSWSEWTLKLPSILGTALTAVCVAIATRRALRREDKSLATVAAVLAVAIFFTCGSDVRHGSVIRLSYLARPDMLQCGLLTTAWLCAWVAIERTTFRRSLVPAVLFWCFIVAAILTKGPAAVMAIVFAAAFAVFASPLSEDDGWGLRRGTTRDQQGNSTLRPPPGLPRRGTDRIARLFSLHWEVGIPLIVLCVGGWLYAAYRVDPDHVRHVMLGAEIGARLTEESPEGFSKPAYFAVMWFVTKAFPWGGLALLAVAYFIGMRLLRTRLAFRFAAPMPSAAIAWLIIVLACLSLPAGKRIDYILPAYAPASLLVAVFLVDLMRRLRVSIWLPIVAPVAMAMLLAYWHLTKFHESVHHFTDHAAAFVRDVRTRLKPGDRLLVLVRGKHPLPTLLGLHQGSYLTATDFLGDEYVIMPRQLDLKPLLESEPLPIGFDDIEKRTLAPLGLYYFPRSDTPIRRLIELQKQIGSWTQTENPYHVPGTVYRDE